MWYRVSGLLPKWGVLSSGGSRIFLVWGTPTPRRGANIWFGQHFTETAWNLKNLERGGGTSKILLCRCASAEWTLPLHNSVMVRETGVCGLNIHLRLRVSWILSCLVSEWEHDNLPLIFGDSSIKRVYSSNGVMSKFLMNIIIENFFRQPREM